MTDPGGPRWDEDEEHNLAMAAEREREQRWLEEFLDDWEEE
jgi:hypothetical protein